MFHADENKSSDESDAMVLRVMLSLTSISEFMCGTCHAVAEICDIDNEELIRLVGQEKVETVCAHDMVGRSMIQCARQPGLGQVCLDSCVHRHRLADVRVRADRCR